MNVKKRRKRENLWTLIYSEFDPKQEKLRETLCTIGNGYFGTRGCFASQRASEIHYPGTYIAGLYDRLPSDVHGKAIFNSDLVNCPNWLLTEFAIDDGAFENPLAMDMMLPAPKLFWICWTAAPSARSRASALSRARAASGLALLAPLDFFAFLAIWFSLENRCYKSCIC